MAKNKRYAVVDLETTGGITNRDKITEVAIILFDGQEVIEEFQSLVNPERSIPPNITRITGISNAMVADAPKFYEIAKTIIELTEGAIFVAHNVRFDYQFLRQEFRSLGYTFTRRNLCTVRLSRNTFPRLKSYSLGNLIKYFKIKVEHRHRAYDDAKATTILLKKIFEEQGTEDINQLVKQTIKLTKLPRDIKPSDVENLPEQCGVYYFADKKGFVIYIGKSINIKSRVKQHFSKQTKKTDNLFQKVADISYEITGSELASLIKESKEIKDVQPEINKIQKVKVNKYAIVVALDKSGYKKYKIVKADKADNPLSYYGSRKSALNHIEQIGEAFQLCQKVNGLDRSTNTCFNYELVRCQGACIGEEPPYLYNERFEESTHLMNRLFEENFLLLEEGREPNEQAVFLVEMGHYRGYGYLNVEDVQYGIEELKECINYEPINPEADLILRNYMWSHPELEVHHF